MLLAVVARLLAVVARLFAASSVHPECSKNGATVAVARVGP